jgi:hypothetical protein
MYVRTAAEKAGIEKFLHLDFGSDFKPVKISESEAKISKQVMDYVADRFSRMKYILGLAIDFAILAQRLSAEDSEAKKFRPDLKYEKIFQTYTLITERGESQANTLTLQYGSTQVGIRKTEESVATLFHGLERTGYPSAYVYNTGQWPKYKALLVMCFQLSESARYELCQNLFDYGLSGLKPNMFFTRSEDRVRLFERIVANYPRTDEAENAGLTFQAIAYGFFRADRPHLNFIVDKVRTGSARQRRFGDVDGYDGLDLDLSVEVKDLHIDTANLDKQLGTFLGNIAGRKLSGIAFVVSIDAAAKVTLERAHVAPFTQEDALKALQTWDWSKQDMAVRAMLHYLAHVEQNPDAVNRLLEFISGHDSQHSSLAYYAKPTVSAVAKP